MTEFPTAPEVARRLADALISAGIPYALGGAIAYGLHAPPRATNDVDLNLFVEPGGLGPAFDALEAAGVELDRSRAQEQAFERGAFEVRLGGMRVDVFLPCLPIYASAQARRQPAVLRGHPIWILSAEDLSVFKLLFFRPKDLVDVERLVAFQGPALDRAYVRRWLVDLVGSDDERVARWDELVARYP